MTYPEIQAAFPHTCAHPLHLCRICRWVLDHRGVITNGATTATSVAEVDITEPTLTKFYTYGPRSSV